MSGQKTKKGGSGGHLCCVSVCSNYYKKTRNSDISYYSFPQDLSLREIWVFLCQREVKWHSNHGRVCSVHFAEDQFADDMEARIMKIKRPKKLKAIAVPTLNLAPSINSEKIRELQSLYEERVKARQLNGNMTHATQEIEPAASSSENQLPLHQTNTIPTLNLAPSINLKKVRVLQILSEEKVETRQSIENLTHASQDIVEPSSKNIRLTHQAENAGCYTCKNFDVPSILLENSRLKDELNAFVNNNITLERTLAKCRRNLKLVEQERSHLKGVIETKELSYKIELEKIISRDALTKSLFLRSQLDLL